MQTASSVLSHLFVLSPLEFLTRQNYVFVDCVVAERKRVDEECDSNNQIQYPEKRKFLETLNHVVIHEDTEALD